MDKQTAIERVKQYTDRIRQSFPVKKVVLFGSYAKETAEEHSDIDVAVIVDVIDNLLSSQVKLFRLRRDIDTRIEPVLMEEKNDRSGFLQEILRTGHVIYSRD
jgi:predicted nucleotidyltransferase